MPRARKSSRGSFSRTDWPTAVARVRARQQFFCAAQTSLALSPTPASRNETVHHAIHSNLVTPLSHPSDRRKRPVRLACTRTRGTLRQVWRVHRRVRFYIALSLIAIVVDLGVGIGGMQYLIGRQPLYTSVSWTVRCGTDIAGTEELGM